MSSDTTGTLLKFGNEISLENIDERLASKIIHCEKLNTEQWDQVVKELCKKEISDPKTKKSKVKGKPGRKTCGTARLIDSIISDFNPQIGLKQIDN